jgi:hypothetical protein
VQALNHARLVFKKIKSIMKVTSFWGIYDEEPQDSQLRVERLRFVQNDKSGFWEAPTP